MKNYLFVFFLFMQVLASGQHISSFLSVEPNSQNENLVLPTTHRLHFIIKTGDSLTDGNVMPANPDFTGYVPINGSSKHGYLCVNSESVPGAVTILEIKFDTTLYKWGILNSQKVNFGTVNGTRTNCSGGITPWGTMITCEETTSSDLNFDGYNDYGWAIEINPATKAVINHPGGLLNGDKLWALGNFPHENITFHTNKRTIYQGIDNTTGYLLKFVADSAEKLYKGNLYAYKGSKNGNGRWVKINNSTAAECNNAWQRCTDSLCTVFSGVEDVEYNTIDGKVYMCVKNEDRVYSFSDDNPLTGDSVHSFQTYVGNTSYNISHINGTTSTAWGTGNDNLCFDTIGNLWVLQDGSNNHIWMVEKGHTQSSPKVKLFARTPSGSEPTGITFTPDDKFMFISIMHPNNTNSTSQKDAYNADVKFDKAVSLIVARDSSFIVLPIVKNSFWGVYDGTGVMLNWSSIMEFNNYGYIIQKSTDATHWQDIGIVMSQNRGNSLTQYTFYDQSMIEQNTFYRLRQTDIQGDETLSEVVLIKPIISQTRLHQSLFPNPVEQNQQVLSTASKPITCLDIYGRSYQIEASLYGNNWKFKAPPSVGIYTIVFENNSSQLLIVNR